MKAQTKQKLKKNAVGYAFILPLLLYFLVFQLAPMLIAMFMSFTNYSIDHLFDYTFVGFKNYIELFTNSAKYPRFWSSLKTTFLYILLTVPANIILALVVSSLLNSKIKCEKFFKTIFYIPSVTVGVAIMVMWKQMLAPDGLINQIFSTNVDFLNNEATALVMFALMSIWGGLGYNVLIMLSAMKNIDPSLYEAAEIDGAGKWKQFTAITMPAISPTTFYLLLAGIINGLLTFDIARIFTGESWSGAAGPKDMGLTSVLYIYYQGVQFRNMPVASVMSMVLFLIIMVITVINYKLGDKWVSYD